MDYKEYKHLAFKHFDDGVLQVTLNRPEVLNATDARMHWEIAQVWKDIDADAGAKVVLVTGAGRAFSVGGDNKMLAQTLGDAEKIAGLWREAGDIVYNMINLDKPIISAINGPAFGAGLAVALLADISIVAENVRFTDGHVILGVAAGDHAVIVWPLLCGMAKAKYYLLTGDMLDGREAERIGLVSLCVPAGQLMDKALETAHKLAAGPQQALRWTKRSLNNWLRMAGPSFDTSLALEMLGFFSADVKEGNTALLEKRPPRFDAR
ncbi:MAG TPA: enoyl-CoA hydratase/isomerase family protein [Candidatus Binataceae bacterium]|jgi:enoyl-CoA hydratase|nr:enoyl-CoA hydratase/isomerase family protein [Candidatus Binataceae bacterium]